MSEDERLLDETVLRRALRLEADEVPPRLDVVALAAAAHNDRELASWLPFVIGAGAVSLVARANAVDLAVGVATFAGPLAELVWNIAVQPSTPLSILAALLVALGYERRLARKENHARAS